MDAWHIWVIIALICFIIEIFSFGFAVICFSFGALAAAVASLFDTSLTIQLLTFAIAAILSFIFMRPLMLKFFNRKSKNVRTNVDALIGRKVVVCEQIEPVSGGRVKVDGDVWKAISVDDSLIEVGSTVSILKVESVVLTVQKL